ncbi:MAG: hypothetical protein KC731_31750 [Myxococcales bacterium]|nr:hypothetical protein [Myxococcales bacterium]
MAFRAALDSLLAELAPDPALRAAFAPWCDLLATVGPTPRRGPLTHDLVGFAGSGDFGINVFDHGTPVLPTARAWAHDHFGDRAAQELAELEASLPAGTAVHAGASHDRRGHRLKLWLAGPSVAQVLSLTGGPYTHLGIDLRPEGLERARGYRPTPSSETSWDRFEAWRLAPPAPSPISHQLLAELGVWSEDPDAKRSYDTIFSPEASLEALFAEEDRCISLGVPAVAPRDRLLALDRRLQTLGLSLRPAAHEVDLHPGQPPRVEILLTIGVV